MFVLAKSYLYSKEVQKDKVIFLWCKPWYGRAITCLPGISCSMQEGRQKVFISGEDVKV
jgi:hypothetical protein